MDSNRTVRKWTEEEDEYLLSQVKSNPQNLTACFLAVAQNIDRTAGAVANHWYTVVSKKPDVTCFFTASSKHLSRNRKNGKGVEINRSIWQRFMQIIRNL